MSDYLGPNQTRVLDSTNRNFDTVVFQKKKPPLSCEYNLNQAMTSEKLQDVVRYIGPSGWSVVGSVKNNASESEALAGDVLCSSAYLANTIKLMALDKGIESDRLIAWVNGWKIKVQGTLPSADENNVIQLIAPPDAGHRLNFVFLEVWKQLVDTTGTIYKYGNVNYNGSNMDNDLVDPVIGIETSLRVQIQYRIRIEEIYDLDIKLDPDGFINTVYAQALKGLPVSGYYFTQVPGDPGLWRAGYGDTASQDDLGTVDGYTYAIPMFVVNRRSTHVFEQDGHSNGAGKTLTDYLAGEASDRPDNLYSTWVVADDIMDLRHLVGVTENYKEICNEGFQKLCSGKLHGTLAASTLGEDHYGVVLTQADSISLVDLAGTNTIGAGDGLRRCFSNAAVTQTVTLFARTINDKSVGTPGSPWVPGDETEISLPIGYPVGTTFTVTDLYSQNFGSISNYSSAIVGSILTITINSGGFAGVSDPITAQVTVSFPAGPYGFSEVPETMYEFRGSDSSSYAFPDNAIRVRTADPVVNNDGTHYQMLQNMGWNNGEAYNFGHQMVYHARGNGSTLITFPRNAYGYDVLGILNVRVAGIDIIPTQVTRTITSYYVYTSPAVADGEDVEFTLYTGGLSFEANKQGRGIIDTFKFAEFPTNETPNGAITSFTVDTTSEAILAMASFKGTDGTGYGYLNVSGSATKVVFINSNNTLPASSYIPGRQASYLTINFTTPPAAGILEIPLLVRTGVGAADTYTFFYKTVPYQGLLDSTAKGAFIAEGPAITTTAGSGGYVNYAYSTGQARTTLYSRTVEGSGTQWGTSVSAGDILTISSIEYVVSSVYSDTILYISEPASSTVSFMAYTIIRKDRASFEARNIVDRLPALYLHNDASANNTPIGNAVSDLHQVLETKIVSRIQDVMDRPVNSVTIGENTAERGRSTISIDGADKGLGNLGLKFEKLTTASTYQKTYQSYVLNKDNEGRLYLAVVGSETGNDATARVFNEASNNDSVDLFELPGRPLTMRRGV